MDVLRSHDKLAVTVQNATGVGPDLITCGGILPRCYTAGMEGPQTSSNFHCLPQSSLRRMKVHKWFILTLAAIISWGLYGVAYNLAARGIPPLPNQVLSTLGLILPALFLIPSVLRERRHKTGLWIAFISGLLGAAGNLALFASLSESGQTAIIFPLTALYPLITVVVAVAFMHERARPSQGLGIALALIAVVLLSMEGGTSSRIVLHLAPWLIFGLAALFAFGLAAVFQKLATNRVSAETAFAMFALAFLPSAVLIFVAERWPQKLEAGPVICSVVGGLLNGIGVLATLAAYRSGGKAAVVTPLAAIYPVITVIIAMTFLGERLNALQATGSILAIIAAFFLAREEGD
jgi:drug/metabolite transporter (DMT)-like permease